MRRNLSITGIAAVTILAMLTIVSPGFAQPDKEEPTEGSDEIIPNDGLMGETPGESEDAEIPETPVDTTESLDTLRNEYFKLRDRLFQSRARASAVSSALYSTRLSLRLGYDSARYYTVTRATIRLDGANIFDDTEGIIANDKSAPRFEGYIAPGRHQISIRIEASGKDDDRFTTIVENSFTVQAIKGEDLEVKATAKDTGDIAYKWSKKQRGSYNLHLSIGVKSVKRKSKGKVKKDARAPSVSPRVQRG